MSKTKNPRRIRAQNSQLQQEREQKNAALRMDNEHMIPKPVPYGTPGIRVIPKSAKTVTMKFESTENGEHVGPIWFDDKKLEGRWFSETEAKALARLVGAKYVGDSAIIGVAKP